MLVNLKRGWFDPAGNRRRPEDNPHDLPDNWEEQLPSTAEKLSVKEAKAVKAEEAEEEAPKKKK
jgi:hypothetical protein